jgi:hypothetical protein
MLDSDSTTCLTDPLPLPGPYATSDAGHCERQQVPSDDAGRLRLMGYDQVLGRPLGFWGSTAMSICQLNFVNDWATHALAYGYNGPILFVSRVQQSGRKQ